MFSVPSSVFTATYPSPLWCGKNALCFEFPLLTPAECYWLKRQGQTHFHAKSYRPLFCFISRNASKHAGRHACNPQRDGVGGILFSTDVFVGCSSVSSWAFLSLILGFVFDSSDFGCFRRFGSVGCLGCLEELDETSLSSVEEVSLLSVRFPKT